MFWNFMTNTRFHFQIGAWLRSSCSHLIILLMKLTMRLRDWWGGWKICGVEGYPALCLHTVWSQLCGKDLCKTLFGVSALYYAEWANSRGHEIDLNSCHFVVLICVIMKTYFFQKHFFLKQKTCSHLNLGLAISVAVLAKRFFLRDFWPVLT